MNARAVAVVHEVFARGRTAVNSASVVLASMRAAELDGGTDKLALAKTYVTKILDAALAGGFCTAEKASSVKGLLCAGIDDFENICELFIKVSKDPAFVQIEQEVASCCASLRRRTHA